jgi:hypothetical protein
MKLFKMSKRLKGEKNLGSINCYNGHLSDITDTFKTFIGHNHSCFKIELDDSETWDNR